MLTTTACIRDGIKDCNKIKLEGRQMFLFINENEYQPCLLLEHYILSLNLNEIYIYYFNINCSLDSVLQMAVCTNVYHTENYTETVSNLHNFYFNFLYVTGK